MQLTRRGIMGMLAAAPLDPERLIWQPGKRLISIPKIRDHFFIEFYWCDRFVRPPARLGELNTIFLEQPHRFDSKRERRGLANRPVSLLAERQHKSV